MQCRNCGDPVDPQRVELGYDYCLKEECQQRCLTRVQLAAIGVNKAADYYLRAEEVVLPPQPPARSSSDDSDGVVEEPRRRRPRPASEKPIKSTLERLREKEVELDAALRRSYEQFCRGEITAREMDHEHDQLIRAFNQRVMAENIRYRSMLRIPHKSGR